MTARRYHAKMTTMQDDAISPADYLKARMEQLLVLLDRQGFHLAGAWLAQAIDAIPVESDGE